MSELIYAEFVYYLQGLGFRIHNALKGGHDESDYEEAVVWLLDADNVPFQQQPLCHVTYKGQQVGAYRPDLIVGEGPLLLELKAVPDILPIHQAQALSYLAVTRLRLALIMNFGGASMQYKRLPNFLEKRQPFRWLAGPAVDLLYPELTNTLLATLHEVHYTLGSGFLHQVYRRATYIELGRQGVQFQYLKELPLRFEGHELGVKSTRLFWVEQKLLLATFAIQEITSSQLEKLRWAMKETECRLGLLANFYPSKLDIRMVRT
jgi:GxxExxY protein